MKSMTQSDQDADGDDAANADEANAPSANDAGRRAGSKGDD